MQNRRKTTAMNLEQANSQSLLRGRVLFRVLALFHHLATAIVLTNIDVSTIQIPELITMFKYTSRYMTAWNFTMQLVYLKLALLCDFLEWMRWHNGTVARKLAKFREFYFSSLVFPNALFVTSLFWAIFSLDRELILPRITDLVMPSWSNHSTHTVIAAVVLLDVVLQPGERPQNDSKHKIALYSVCVLYQLVICCTYLELGFWIYPFYNHFNIFQYFLFCLLILAICTVSYELQWSLEKWTRKIRSIRTIKSNKYKQK